MILAGDGGAPWSRVSLTRGSVLSLMDRLGRAEFSGPKAAPAGEVTFKQFPLRALRADLTGVKQTDPARPVVSSVKWSGVKLGKNPVFLASHAFDFREGPVKLSEGDGVEFMLLVNRKRVSRVNRNLPIWLGFDVDLAQFAGQTVELELAISSLSNTAQDVACWGEPELLDAELLQAPAPEAAGK